MTSYRFTRYPSVYDAKGATCVEWSGDELEALLASAQSYTGEKLTQSVMCTATFRSGHRMIENVIAASMMGLDVDAKEQRAPHTDPGALAKSVAATLGAEVFAHSTYSSARDAWCMRLFVPFTEPVKADTYASAWAFVARLLREKAAIVVDGSTKDASHSFFEPCIPPSGLYFHTRIAGDALPGELAASFQARWLAAKAALEAAATPPRSRPMADPNRGDKVDRARRYLAAIPGAISGQGGSVATFTVAAKLVRGFALSDAETFALMSEWNRTCSPPWHPRDLARKIREAREKARSFPPRFLLESTR